MTVKEIGDVTFLCTEMGAYQLQEIQRVVLARASVTIHFVLGDEDNRPVVFTDEDEVEELRRIFGDHLGYGNTN